MHVLDIIDVKQYSPMAHANRTHILPFLKKYLSQNTSVLELGAGSGQQAAFFAKALPHLYWQPSDLPHKIDSMRAWCNTIPNCGTPIVWNIQHSHQGIDLHHFDAIVLFNVLETLSFSACKKLCAFLQHAKTDTQFICYTPFFTQTEPSHALEQYHAQLVRENCDKGVKKYADIAALLEAAGFVIISLTPVTPTAYMLRARKN